MALTTKETTSMASDMVRETTPSLMAPIMKVNGFKARKRVRESTLLLMATSMKVAGKTITRTVKAHGLLLPQMRQKRGFGALITTLVGSDDNLNNLKAFD